MPLKIDHLVLIRDIELQSLSTHRTWGQSTAGVLHFHHQCQPCFIVEALSRRLRWAFNKKAQKARIRGSVSKVCRAPHALARNLSCIIP